MKAFIEIKKLAVEDIITTSIVDGLVNNGTDNDGNGKGNSGGWDDGQATSLTD